MSKTNKKLWVKAHKIAAKGSAEPAKIKTAKKYVNVRVASERAFDTALILQTPIAFRALLRIYIDGFVDGVAGAVRGQGRKTYDVPPKIAEFMLTMLATTRGAEAMIGDLNERFTRECKEFDRDRAVRLYWARTLRSLGPLLWRAIGKVVITMVKRFFGPGAA
jgi:hypothetical protein